MLHTCQSCGEAWETGYIASNPALFEITMYYMDPADVHHCPNCNVPIGIPGITTKRSLARAFITRLAGGHYIGTKMFHSSDRNLLPMSRSVAEVYNALRT